MFEITVVFGGGRGNTSGGGFKINDAPAVILHVNVFKDLFRLKE
jgi:hypothetical protein